MSLICRAGLLTTCIASVALCQVERASIVGTLRGNAGRNVLTGPRSANFDFTAEKKFLFTETRQILFRAEFFNAFNHPQFNIPASTIGATGVGTISATARPSRQIQFALKLLF